MGIPVELISLFGASLFGGIMKIWSSAIQTRRLERLMGMQAFDQRMKFIESARTFDNKGFQWTRRLIALTAVFSVIALPKLVAIFYPEIAIHIGYPQLSKGFLFFTSDYQKIKWIVLKGLVITPLDTHLLSAIIGLYFGGSLVKHN